MSNRCVVNVGENLGFDIVGVTPSNFHASVIEDCDVAVVNNFFQFSKDQVRSILDVLWGKGKPYVKYEHDSREIGRRSFADRLFKESVLNVFLSPAHLNNHRCHLGCDGVALPLAIQTDLFKPVPGVARDNNMALIVGGWIRGGKTEKALRQYVAENRNLLFVSVGFDLPGMSSVPHCAIENMPTLYSKAGRLVHLPDIVCAGERVVFEAALCGCSNIVTNDRVGHASWNRDLSDTEGLREWLRQAPFDFWKAVETAVGGKA